MLIVAEKIMGNIVNILLAMQCHWLKLNKSDITKNIQPFATWSDYTFHLIFKRCYWNISYYVALTSLLTI